MTRADFEEPFEVIVIRRRDVTRRGPGESRELAARAACPECGERGVRVSMRDHHGRSPDAGRPRESSGAGWDLLRLAGLCWLLSQPLILLGLGLAMGWYVIVATRDVVDDEIGR